jgi:PIN domain nuclease of toxin-antitoxin system
MRVLFDTHSFLWWITDDPRLSLRAREIMSDGENRLFFSAASAWEIAIKARLGRLAIAEPVATFVPAQLAENAIEGLPIAFRHALHVYSLPDHHRDPFDRMPVAQSQIENLPILTGDPLIAQYSVETIW